MSNFYLVEYSIFEVMTSKKNVDIRKAFDLFLLMRIVLRKVNNVEYDIENRETGENREMDTLIELSVDC